MSVKNNFDKSERFIWPKPEVGDLITYEYNNKIFCHLVILSNLYFRFHKMRAENDFIENINTHFVSTCRNMTLIQNNGNVIRKEGCLK